MKFSFKLLGLLLLFYSCKGQKTKPPISNPIILPAHERSLYSNQVDWQNVNQKFLELTKDQEDLVNLKPGLAYLINSLNDQQIISATQWLNQ